MSILILRSSVAASGGGGEDNDGLVVSDYANFDPDDSDFQSLVVNSTIPNWGTTAGANITFANETWWNGASVPVATLFPPTAESASGFGSVPFWKSGTKAVRQLNYRIEFKVSDLFCAESTGYPKFFIFRCATTLNPAAELNHRPMVFIAHGNQDASLGAANSITFAPAIGTLRMFSSTNIVPAANADDRIASGDTDPGTFCTMAQPLYVAASAGTDTAGNPIIDADEYLCMEIRLQMMSTTDEPDGFVGYRIYRRNGAVYERGCSLTWDDTYPVDTLYIADIDTCGGGYYNLANSGSASLYTKVGRVQSMAFNYQPTTGRAWKGPPTGYVTG